MMTKFSFRKTFLSSAVAVAMVSGVVISNNASAIHVAEDGIGQVMLAPYYDARTGTKTKFALVNTRDDVAVKAKVVFRSFAQSTEVLDFICYLTPGDVCRFEVINKNGQAYLYSKDDSIKSSGNPVMFGSQKDVDQQLFDDTMKRIDGNDINEVGHVEIIGAYAAMGTIVTPQGAVTITRGMSKFDLMKVFDTPRGGLTALNGGEVRASGRLVGGVCTPLTTAPTDYDAGAPCPAPAGNVRSTDPNVVRLTGSVEIVKEDNSDRMGYSLSALAGELWDNTPDTVSDPGTLSLFDGRVIHNPGFDTTVATATALGAGFPVIGDNIFEIEHALAASNLMGTYEKDSVHNSDVIVTFPTRYRHRAAHVCNGLPASPAEIGGALYTEPFNANGSVQYGLASFDNSENTLVTQDIFSGGTTVTSFLLAEVNYVMPAWPFESGWYNMLLVARAGCNYSGVPSLGMTRKWMSGTHMNSMLVPTSNAAELTNRQFDDLPVGNDMGL
jgi:hypothetical protein